MHDPPDRAEVPMDKGEAGSCRSPVGRRNSVESVYVAQGDVCFPGKSSVDPEDRPPLQISPQLLLALDGLEQSLKVPLAERPGTLALNDLKKDRGSVLYRFGEDL